MVFLFKSADDALKFAFNASEQCYDRPPVNKIAAPAISSGKGLGGFDGAGQAGMILREVEQMGQIAKAVIFAKYCHPYDNHSRDSFSPGRHYRESWRNAVAYLAHESRSTALSGCGADGRMRLEYVGRYFSAKKDRMSLEDVADRYGVHRQTASAHYGRICRWLGGNRSEIGLVDSVLSGAEILFRDLGMVGDDN